MNDRRFLAWLHERLECVHGENPHLDYMRRLREIIMATPADRRASDTRIGNDSADPRKSVKLSAETEVWS